MSTPTPRTDAKLLTVAQRTSPHYLPEMVWADFARELERELADQAARFHDEIVRRQGIVRDNHELNLKERDQLRTALATERSRLDWLESKRPILWSLEDHASGSYWLLTDFPGYTEEAASQHKTARAAIDAAMKESAK